MTEKTLTVYEALMEVKKINDKLNNKLRLYGVSEFIGYGPEKSKNIKGVDRDTYIRNLQSNYDSISHLIKNLAEYKAKIALSNAVTTIVIGEKEYTIAEAIQRKDILKEEERLLQSIRNQMINVEAEISKQNNKVEDNLPVYLEKVTSENSTTEDIEKLSENYRLDHKYVVIDPNNLYKITNEKVDELEVFTNEVDSKITASNCSTMITVQLAD